MLLRQGQNWQGQLALGSIFQHISYALQPALLKHSVQFPVLICEKDWNECDLLHSVWNWFLLIAVAFYRCAGGLLMDTG